MSCFLFITGVKAQQSTSTSQATAESVVRVEIVSTVGSQNGNDLTVDLSPGSKNSNNSASGNNQTTKTSTDSTNTSGASRDSTQSNSQNQKNNSSTNKSSRSASNDNQSPADSLVTLSIPQTSPNAGWLQITGPQNQTVIMTVQAPDSLVNSDGSVIPFDAKEAYNSDAPQANKANPYGKNSTKNVQLNDKVSGSSGAAYLWVYGDLHVAAPKPGNYVGVFQVTVTY